MTTMPRETSDPQPGAAAVTEPAPTGVLWSAATAREIVAAIAQDVHSGRLLPAEAMDLIDRVGARAASARVSAGAVIWERSGPCMTARRR